jgi:predicted protein tyrosine phosphatase
MQRIIVSSLVQVPFLVERFQPDSLLSIAAVPATPSYMTPSQHRVLNFADIDAPDARNVILAATKAHIATIESLRESGTLLINCQLGQRRSPTAALILLAALFPGREAALAEWILAEAPYVEYNRWMLSLASGDFRSVTALERPRVPAPPGCFFELDLDTARGIL